MLRANLSSQDAEVYLPILPKYGTIAPGSICVTPQRSFRLRLPFLLVLRPCSKRQNGLPMRLERRNWLQPDQCCLLTPRLVQEVRRDDGADQPI
jgi:hypothetical protein